MKKKIATGKVSWRWSNVMKTVAVLSAGAVLGLGAFAAADVIRALFSRADLNAVGTDYASVSFEVQEGEKFSPELFSSEITDEDNGAEGGFTALEIFGRLNWKFSQARSWTSEYHSTVSTVVQQEVANYKAYSDGVLLSADITKSSVINEASLFCFLKDENRVMWQKPVNAKAIDPFEWLSMEWTTGTPYRNMAIEPSKEAEDIDPEAYFKTANGLPGYVLSPYIIREETILSEKDANANLAAGGSDEVVDLIENGDGTYTVEFVLKPETWEVVNESGGKETHGAAAYYINQMIFTGGLPEAPVFSEITLTFTFDSDWTVLATGVEEKYTAKYGIISAPCTSTSHKEIYYDGMLYGHNGVAERENAEFMEEYYTKYFEPYADGPFDGKVGRDPTPTDCLLSMATGLLGRESSLALDVTFGDRRTDGVIFLDTKDLDIGNIDFENLDLTALLGQVDARVRLGDALRLWLSGGDAYLAYGGVKGKLGIDGLIGLVSPLVSAQEEQEGSAAPPSEEPPAEPAEEESGLLAAITGGEFTFDEEHASLCSKLPLFGIEIPVNFYFLLDEKGNASLDRITLEMEVNGEPFSATIAYGDETLPALGESEREEYIDLIPYAEDLRGLLASPYLHATVGYTAGGVDLTGEIDVFMETYGVSATLTASSVAHPELSKTVTFAYTDGSFFVALDGIRLKASLFDVASLVSGYLDMPDGGDGASLDVGDLVFTLLDPAFAENIATYREENALLVALKGTELLKAFGIDFKLGDVSLAISEGRLSADALGIGLSVEPGAPFTVDKTGYIDVAPYAKQLLRVFGGGYAEAEIGYETGDFSVRADLAFDLGARIAAGEVRLSYRSAEKLLRVALLGGTVYLEADGVKLSAGVREAAELVAAFAGVPAGDEGSAELTLIERVLGLDVDALASLGEENGELTLAIEGTELLKAFGVDFGLGGVTVTVGGDALSLSALGADVEIRAGEPFTVGTLDGYLDILPHIRDAIGLLSKKAVALEVHYGAPEADWQVQASLSLDLETFALGGTAAVSYRGNAKEIGVAYADGAIYLELDGLKVYAGVKEAAGLVRAFVSESEERGENSQDAVEQLLSLDLGDLLGLVSEDGVLTATVHANALLSALGVPFELGDAAITVEQGRITADVLGVHAVVTPGDAPAMPDTSDYIGLVPYAEQLADILGGGLVHAAAEYTSKDGAFSVSAEADVDLNNLAARAQITVGYKGAEKPVVAVYADGTVYLDIDGVKLSANAKDAAELVAAVCGVPESGAEELGLLEKAFSLDLSRFVTLKEAQKTLLLTVSGTELLKEFGADLALGGVTVSVGGGKVTAEAFGANITLQKGERAVTGAEGDYTDILPHARRLIALLQNDYLSAHAEYEKDRLAITADLYIDLRAPALSAIVTVAYGKAEKKLSVIYGEGTVYLDVDGVKISADLDEAVSLVLAAVGAEDASSEERDLIADVFSLSFGGVLGLETDSDALRLTVAGTELLKAFGFDFALGTVTVTVRDGSLEAAAFGATVAVTAGNAPDRADPDDYIGVMPYAETIADLVLGGVVRAEVGYTAKELSVKGDISVAFREDVLVKGELNVTYGKIGKKVGLIYAGGTVYVEVEGVKVSANAKEAAQFVLARMGVTLSSPDEEKLLENVLGLRFGDFMQFSELGERGEKLHIAVNGGALLQALGFDFALGDVAIDVTDGAVSVSAMGASVTLTAGEQFTVATDGYADLMRYAEIVYGLYEGGYLTADVSYETETLQIGGTVDFAIGALAAQANFILSYKNAPHTLDVLYTDGVLCLGVDGIRVKANVSDAIAFVKQFVAIEENDFDAQNLIETLLSVPLNEIVGVSEAEGALSVVVHGMRVLGLLGVDLKGVELGDVTLTVTEGAVTAAAMGANVTVKAGGEFPVSTDGYADILKYAEAVKELIDGKDLHAEVAYTGETLSVKGEADLSLKPLAAKGTFDLTYNEKTKKIGVIYKDGAVYLELDGIKVSANAKEAAELVGQFVDIPKKDFEAKAILEDLFQKDLGALLNVTEANDTLSLTLAGTDILSLLGIKFSLGEVQLDVSQSEIVAKALDATVTLTAGRPFENDTAGYVDILQYANAVYGLYEHGYLAADVAFGYGDLAVSGEVKLNFKDLSAVANLKISYKGEPEGGKPVTVIYGTDGLVYVAVDGLRFKADPKEAYAVVAEYFLEGDAQEEGSEEAKLLETLFSIDVGTLVPAFGEEEDVFSLTVAGGELMSLLGADVELGDVVLTVDKEGAIGLNTTLFGKTASINVKKTNAFTVLPAGTYVDLVPYLDVLFSIAKSGYLTAQVQYGKEGDAIAVSGTLDLGFRPLVAKAALSVVCTGEDGKKQTNEIGVIYQGGTLYLRLGDTVKVCAGLEDAIALVTSFTGSQDAPDLIAEILSWNFSDIIGIAEEDGALRVGIAGSVLLEKLGVDLKDFELGSATLEIGKKNIILSALDATVTVTAGEQFEAETKGYVDLIPYAEFVSSLIKGGYLEADVAYTGGKLTVQGSVRADLKKPAAVAELSLTYNGVPEEGKRLTVIYGADGTVYAAVDGLRFKADVNELIELIGGYIDLSPSDVEAKKVLADALSLDLEKLLTVSENEEDELTLVLKGSDLLKLFGVDFGLGDVTLTVGQEELCAELKGMGVSLSVRRSDAFAVVPVGTYIDVVPYAQTVAEILAGGYAHVTATYDYGKLSMTADARLGFGGLKSLSAVVGLKVTYNDLPEGGKSLTLCYTEGKIYLEAEGIKASVTAEELVALVKQLADVKEDDESANGAIEALLGANFAFLLKDLKEEKDKDGNDALSFAVAGSELLGLFGVKFDLGDVEIQIGKAGVGASLTLLGNTLSLNVEKDSEENFPAFDQENAVPLGDYIGTVATLAQSEYLVSDISYTSDLLTAEGKIFFALKAFAAQAELTVTYQETEHAVKIGYVQESKTLYLDIDGIRVKADPNDAIAFVKKIVKIPESDLNAQKLLEKLFSADLGKLVKLSETVSEEKDVLRLAIEGTELLNALGLDLGKFELGDVTVDVGQDGSVKLSAHGATVTVTAGDEFTVDTAGYADILRYAEAVKALIDGNFLHATVAYTGETLSVKGEADLSLKPLAAKGTFDLTYNEKTKKIGVIYKDGAVYLELDGIKVSANAKEAAELVGQFVDIPKKDFEAKAILEDLFQKNLGALLNVTEANDTLSLTLAGTDILSLLGIKFSLGEVQLDVSQSEIVAKALDATVTLTKGTEVTAETAGYADLTEYAKQLAKLYKGNFLAANVNYRTENGKFSVRGEISFDIKELLAQGTLSLTYNGKTKQVGVIFSVEKVLSEGETSLKPVLYLELDGVKLSVSAQDAVSVVMQFIGSEDGAESGEDEEAKDLLATLFGVRLGDLLKVYESASEEGGENDTLNLLLKGSDLMKLFGIDFALGDVDLTVGGGEVNASAMGVTITVQAGEKFTPQSTDGYLDVGAYAKAVAAVVKQGKLGVALDYENKELGLAVSGTLDLSLETLLAQAKLTLTYKSATKQLDVLYGEGVLYLTLYGGEGTTPIKLSAGVKDAIKIVKEFVALDDISLEQLLTALLSLNFRELIPAITAAEDGTALDVAVAVDELLNKLSVPFSLGEIGLKIGTDGTVEVSMLDGTLTATAEAGEKAPDEAIPEEYIDAIPYANTIVSLIKSGYLEVKVGYTGGGLTVQGTVGLQLSPLLVKSDLTLRYGSIDRTLHVAYATEEEDGKPVAYLYITVDNPGSSEVLKLKANTSEAVGVVMGLLGIETGSSEEKDVLERVLGLDFAALLTLSEISPEGGAEGHVLKLTVAGNELLQAFGVNFNLGNVELTVTDNVTDKEIKAEASSLGVSLSVKKGDTFTVSTEGYYDVTSVIDLLPSLLAAKGVSFNGNIQIDLGGKNAEEAASTSLVLTVNEGYLSWKEGLHVYLDGALVVNHETEIDLVVAIDFGKDEETGKLTEGELTVVYSGIAVRVSFDELQDLQAAFRSVYGRIRTLLNKMVQDDLGPLLPEELSALLPKDLSDLLGKLQGGADLADALGGFDWTKLVQDLILTNYADKAHTDMAGGVLSATYSGLDGFGLDILEPKKNGEEGPALQLNLIYTGKETLRFIGTGLGLDVIKEEDVLPKLKAEGALQIADFADLLDYLGAAVSLLEQHDLTVQFGGLIEAESYVDESGETVSYPKNYVAPDGETKEHERGVRYSFDGAVSYNAGDNGDTGLPFHLDRENKNFYVDPDIFLKLTFNLRATTAADTSVYLEIVALDSDMSGQQNNYLDFYITASTVGAGKEGYDPLRVYVSGDEILTVLAGVFEVLGVDTSLGEQLGGLLTDYFIAPWMETFAKGMEGVDTQEILARLKTLGESLLYSLGLTGGKEPAEEAAGADGGTDASLPEQTVTKRDYIKSVTRTEGKFELVLSGEALFGSGAQDLTASIEKSGGAGSSVLTGVALSGIPAGGGNLSLHATFDSQTPVENAWETPARYSATNTDGYFAVEGVKDILIALGMTATHEATAEEIAASEGALKEGDFVRSNLFFVDGELKLDLSIIGLNLETINIKIDGLTVNFDEKGDISMNAKLSYDGVRNTLAGLMGDSVIIKGDTVLELTMKEGMMYLRRTQSTYFDGSNEKPLAAPEVIYRAFPLSNFMKDTPTMMDHICFMFNLSEKLITNIMNNITGGGGTPAASPTDLGGYLKKYVKEANYKPLGTAGSLDYSLILNGAGLTGSDSFGDITVDLGIRNFNLRSITIPTFSIASVVKINAALNLRNPGYQWDAGCSDTTTSIANILEEGMKSKLTTADWSATKYLEGQLTTATYMLGDDTIGTQSIVFDTTTKELYADLVYPAFTEEQRTRNPGFAPVWSEPDRSDLAAGIKVYATYQPNSYTFVFDSEYEFEGFEKNGSGWSMSYEWTAQTGKFPVPEAINGEKEIVGLTYNGELLDPDISTWLWLFDHENGDTVHFGVATKDVEYTVTFDVNGKTQTAAGKYGDNITYPATEGTKTGYSFKEWSENLATFGEIWEKHGHATELTITASYTPNTYIVTLVSDYMITFDGFEFGERGDGQYFATYNFTYDTEVKLPTFNDGVQLYVLNGFTLDGDETNTTYTQIPNVARDMVLRAVWAERGVDVVFGEEIVNRHVGETIQTSEIPAAPHKDGYRAYWTLNGEELSGAYTLNEDDIGEGGKITFEAGYEAIEYTVTVRSAQPVAGFEEDENGYYKTYRYTFDSTAQTLENLTSSGYDFVGYTYNGTAYSQIDSYLIAAFGYKDGTLTVEWKNNKVEVTFYSDFDFEGRTGRDSVTMLYSVTNEYKDGSYEIGSFTLTPSTRNDIQQLGWWYQDEGKWSNVTNVSKFVSENADESKVSLYALWIENIVVTLTNLQPDDPNAFSTYSFAGTSTGGRVIGNQSDEIYKTAGITKEMTAKFIIYISRSSIMGGGYNADELSGGDSFTLGDDGAFSVGPLTSGSSFLGGGAEYGGVHIILTFSYKGSDNQTHSISTDWNAAVSYKKYSVRVIRDGAVVKEQDCRDDFDEMLITKGATFSKNYDNWTYVRDILDGVLLAKEGYTAYWAINGVPVTGDEKITGATDIVAVYTPNRYAVQFTSDNGFDDYKAEAADTLRDLTELPYGSQISFVAEGADNTTFTVGIGPNNFTVPAVPVRTGYTAGKWRPESDTTDSNGARKIVFTVDYTVNYYSVKVTGEESENYAGLLPSKLPYDTVISFVESVGGHNKVIKTYTVTVGENTIALPEKEGYTASYSVSSNTGNVITVEVTYVEKTFNYTIKFHHNDGTETVDEVPETAHFTNTTYEVTVLEHGITREFYEFKGWYFDKAGEQPFTAWTAEPNKTLEVYAKWEAIDYKIVYTSQGLPEGAEFTHENAKTWNAEQVLFLQDASYNDSYTFGGWFAADGTQVTKIDKENAKQYIDEATKQISLFAKFYVDTTYTFHYSVSEKYIELTCAETASAKVGGSITLPAYDASGVNKYDNDIVQQWYFAGWQLPNDDTIYELGAKVMITTDHVSNNADATVIISAVWKEKTVVTFQDTVVGFTSRNYYYLSEQTVAISGVTITANNTTYPLTNAAGEDALSTLQSKDYDVNVSTYYNESETWGTNAGTTAGSGSAFTATRSNKVILTVNVTATGKEGTKSALVWDQKTGDDVTLTVTLSGDETKTAQSIGKGGEKGWAFRNESVPGSSDPKSFTLYLKPDQDYTISYQASANATVKVDNVQVGTTTGEVKGKAGKDDFTITITAS